MNIKIIFLLENCGICGCEFENTLIWNAKTICFRVNTANEKIKQSSEELREFQTEFENLAGNLVSKLVIKLVKQWNYDFIVAHFYNAKYLPIWIFISRQIFKIFSLYFSLYFLSSQNFTVAYYISRIPRINE